MPTESGPVREPHIMAAAKYELSPEITVQIHLPRGMEIRLTALVQDAAQKDVDAFLDMAVKAIDRQEAVILLNATLGKIEALKEELANVPTLLQTMTKTRLEERAILAASFSAANDIKKRALGFSPPQRQKLDEFDTETKSKQQLLINREAMIRNVELPAEMKAADRQRAVIDGKTRNEMLTALSEAAD